MDVGIVADGSRWLLIALLALACLEKASTLVHHAAAWHPVMLLSPARRRWASTLMSVSLLADAGVASLLLWWPRLAAGLVGVLIVTYTWAAWPLHEWDGASDCRCFFKLRGPRTRLGFVVRNVWLLLLASTVLATPPNYSRTGPLLGVLLFGVTLLAGTVGDGIARVSAELSHSRPVGALYPAPGEREAREP